MGFSGWKQCWKIFCCILRQCNDDARQAADHVENVTDTYFENVLTSVARL